MTNFSKLSALLRFHPDTLFHVLHDLTLEAFLYSRLIAVGSYPIKEVKIVQPCPTCIKRASESQESAIPDHKIFKGTWITSATKIIC
jgi:hypothetical protein